MKAPRQKASKRPAPKRSAPSSKGSSPHGAANRIVRGGLIQMANPINDADTPVSQVAEAMLDKHLPLVTEAGKRGVQILCLQEIFNGPYFCPSQDARWCDIA